MRFSIKHDIKGRIRVHLAMKRMSDEQADILCHYLSSQESVRSVTVHERTMNATITYTGDRSHIINTLLDFSFEKQSTASAITTSDRAMSRHYHDRLIGKVVFHYGKRLFIPAPIRGVITVFNSIKYIRAGLCSLLNRRIEVPVLDATAITVSLLRNDTATAGSVMFLLGIGEILEEWTHKKSVNDLARSMSLNIDNVWLCTDDSQVLTPACEIRTGDLVCVLMGSIIPFDGSVVSGEAMVNQASLTGESVAVAKTCGSTVYAGTVVEEGELVIKVCQVGDSSKYAKIVTMIEESEKLKSSVESAAEHLADRLVPYTLAGTGLTWLITRNTTRALSVLMVDFSCALKLAMPISVLSAIREASTHHITVKGGKFLEAMAKADTIIFDKTGTLTNATPAVCAVIPFNGKDTDELLRMAACLEEHFPHSMATAVVDAAKKRGLDHQELHSKVEYIVAHGISSRIGDAKVVIGSYHFVFEDEGCHIPDNMKETFDNLPAEYSQLYLAIDNVLEAVICIEDPLRPEASLVIDKLRAHGIQKIVMMTGDSDRTARAIAKKVGVDEYYSEVLPEDKADYISRERAAGHTVIMVGDGINDSPALSAADIGVAISEGAQLAREIADVTIAAGDLCELIKLRCLSQALMHRIHTNYQFIVGFNAALILLGVGGIIQPTLSAFLHNSSTLGISLKSMEELLVTDEN